MNMKWSSSSNSSLSSSAGLTVNGSGGSGSNCNTNHSGSVQNGGLRSNASDRRSIFYTDSTDIDIMKSFNNNNKVRKPTHDCELNTGFGFMSFFLAHSLVYSITNRINFVA